MNVRTSPSEANIFYEGLTRKPPTKNGNGRKRALDFVLALSALIFIAPVFLTIMAVLRFGGGSVFFRHRRVGRNGVPFDCLKFRSMAENAEELVAKYLEAHPEFAEEWRVRRKLVDDPRVTRFGRFIRTTSLDELPQLINVLRGEMSLVGPRPVITEELDLYYGSTGRDAYLSVLPGITGLWQVSGRSRTSYAERVSLDIRYVNERSLRGDIQLLLKTIPAVLRRQGAV